MSSHKQTSGSLIAAAFPHSGSWLAALVVPSCGLCLVKEAAWGAVSWSSGRSGLRCADAVGAVGHNGLFVDCLRHTPSVIMPK